MGGGGLLLRHHRRSGGGGGGTGRQVRDEGSGRLLVDGGERGDVANELVQQVGVEARRLVADGGLLRQHDVLGSLGVCGQQAPVHVGAVAQVRIVRLLRGVVEDRLQQGDIKERGSREGTDRRNTLFPRMKHSCANTAVPSQTS